MLNGVVCDPGTLKPASAPRVWLSDEPETFPCAYFIMPVLSLKKVAWFKKKNSATHQCLTNPVIILFDLCTLLAISPSYFLNTNIKFLIYAIIGMQVPTGSKTVACSWCRVTFAAVFLFWFTLWIFFDEKNAFFLISTKKQCLMHAYKYVPYILICYIKSLCLSSISLKF